MPVELIFELLFTGKERLNKNNFFLYFLLPCEKLSHDVIGCDDS